MPGTRGIVVGLLLAAPVLLAQNLAQNLTAPDSTAIHHRHHKSHKTPPLVLPPLPGGPLSQLPMDQIPAMPAKVTFQDGLLTISAQNSNLGEILRDVRRLTGASIEIPAGTGVNERVVTHLGPGAPRDVLAGLLNGSSFNYVMMGSSSDPAAVASVILTAKPSTTGETQAAANVYQNNPVVMQNRFPQAFSPVIAQSPPGAEQPAADAEDAKDDEENADDNTDDQGQPQPGQAPGNALNPQDQQQPQDPNQPNAGPRTPEQILEMLRRPQQPGGAVVTPPQTPQEQ